MSCVSRFFFPHRFLSFLCIQGTTPISALIEYNNLLIALSFILVVLACRVFNFRTHTQKYLMRARVSNSRGMHSSVSCNSLLSKDRLQSGLAVKLHLSCFCQGRWLFINKCIKSRALLTFATIGASFQSLRYTESLTRLSIARLLSV